MVTLSGRYPLGGSPLVVRGIDLTLEGVGAEGAILDAEGVSRAIEVTAGGSLTLRQIHVVNGNTAASGGGVLVHGAGSALLMERSSIRDSVTSGGLSECSECKSQWTSHGGGGLCVQKGASAVLVDSVIADCACTNAAVGGGAYVGAYAGPEGAANLTLRGSRIERCNATAGPGWGGAIGVYHGSRVELLHSVLSECRGNRGGVDVYGGHLLAKNSVRGADRSNSLRKHHPFHTHMLTTVLCPPPPGRRRSRTVGRRIRAWDMAWGFFMAQARWRNSSTATSCGAMQLTSTAASRWPIVPCS